MVYVSVVVDAVTDPVLVLMVLTVDVIAPGVTVARGVMVTTLVLCVVSENSI